MLIEIWSDVACPWCYIGKRRLEKALGEFGHDDEVEIRYRSFELDPGAPTEATESVAAMLGRKYGGGEANGKQMIDRVEATAAEEGLLFRHHESIHANTRDAHRVLHLAEAEGKQLELKEALLDAYFVKGANVARHETLLELAATVGLEEKRVREVLDSREYDADVDRDIAEAGALGATGVPFFVIDRKYGVAGAQPAEVFTQILERAWTESHPKLDLVGGADVCGPDGCAI